MFVDGAFKVNPLPDALTIHLDQLNALGVIEHDVSLSRDDAALGNKFEFSPERWQEMLQVYASGQNGIVTYKEASKARYTRAMLSKERREAIGTHVEYRLRVAFLGYGETASWFVVLGKDGEVALKYLKVFFGEYIPGTEKRILTGLRGATNAAC